MYIKIVKTIIEQYPAKKIRALTFPNNLPEIQIFMVWENKEG